MLLDVFLQFGREAITRSDAIDVAVTEEDAAPFSLAKSRPRLRKSVQHDLEIERRTANNLENICGGGLLLQGFAQFIEQPRVLDGDDSLVSKGLDELDLLLGERLDPLPRKAHDADRFGLAHQRYAEQGSCLCNCQRLWNLIFLVRCEVGDLQCTTLKQHSPRHRVPSDDKSASLEDGFLEVDSVRRGLGCGTHCRHITETIAIPARDERHFC